MNLLTLNCLVLAALVGAENDAAWSKPVNGLRGRLIIEPAKEQNSPFCRVFVELENVDDVAGQKRIRFDTDKLSLRVTDSDGKALSVANGPYDGRKPLWETIALPFEGTIKFRVSFSGLGYKPGLDRAIIDIDGGKAWIIPQDASAYYLSGSLTIAKEKGDHPHMDWSGTLELPKALIPKAQ